jgi:Haem-binding domain
MKILKRLAVAAGVLLVAMQAIRPARTNPPIDPAATLRARAQVPPEVDALLARSCDDCHTSETRWPWYSQVAPASWLVARDVNEARRKLSLSDWGRYDARRAGRKLDQMCEEVKDGGMPITPYLLLHRSARLSEADKKTLCDWTRAEQGRIAPEPR